MRLHLYGYFGGGQELESPGPSSQLFSASRDRLVPFAVARKCMNCLQELKSELKSLGLPQTGRKDELVKRLEDALNESVEAEPVQQPSEKVVCFIKMHMK